MSRSGGLAATHLSLVGVTEHHPRALLALGFRKQVVHDLDLRLLDTEHDVDFRRQLGDNTSAGLKSQL
jgi:hypothetical protein